MNLREQLDLGDGVLACLPTPEVDSVGRQVCAFLNSGGGRLVIGMDEQGQAVPNAMPNATPGELRTLENEVMAAISPTALVSFEQEQVRDAIVWHIEVPAGKDFPYSFRNQIFVQNGTQTQLADGKMVRDMIMSREIEPERWERRFSDATLPDDLSEAAIREFVSYRHENGHTAAKVPTGDPVAVLEGVGMIRYGRLCNAGDVLFAREPVARHPQARVRCAAFAGKEVDSDLLDHMNTTGPVMEALEQAFAFVRRNTRRRGQLRLGDVVREDQGEIPDDALREGLVNAFAHRNYADYRGGIWVQVHPDRVEIRNSGDFPDGKTPAELKGGGISILRNPDIAHVLYLRGFMEKLGRGWRLIRNACNQAGLPEPVWDSTGGDVRLIFLTPESESDDEPSIQSNDDVARIEQTRNGLQVILGQLMLSFNLDRIKLAPQTKLLAGIAAALQQTNVARVTVAEDCLEKILSLTRTVKRVSTEGEQKIQQCLLNAAHLAILLGAKSIPPAPSSQNNPAEWAVLNEVSVAILLRKAIANQLYAKFTPGGAVTIYDPFHLDGDSIYDYWLKCAPTSDARTTIIFNGLFQLIYAGEAAPSPITDSDMAKLKGRLTRLRRDGQQVYMTSHQLNMQPEFIAEIQSFGIDIIYILGVGTHEPIFDLDEGYWQATLETLFAELREFDTN